MVKGKAFGAAIVGEDVHHVLLLARREKVLAVMVAVVRAAAAAEVTHDVAAGLSPQILRHILVELLEAPGHLHGLGLSVAPALPVLPGIRIDGWSTKTLCRLELIGLIVKAALAQLARFVETKCISKRNFFRF